MASEPSTASLREICAFLASTWLQQQDLHGKSPTEISDMYFGALREIMANYNEKYSSKKQSKVTARVISPGIERDDW